MEAIGKHDFIPSDPATELAFNQGDKLLILNYLDTNVQWYNAQKDGQFGLVPGNYIIVTPVSWYSGRTSRAHAEQYLQNQAQDGAFLVRLSESSPNDFSLSVKCGNSVQHFRIIKDKDNRYFLWSKTFESLNELVDHYKQETVSRTSQILLREIDENFTVEALYDFTPPENGGEADSELAFNKGAIIMVFDSRDDNWWGGQIDNRSGYFPRSYVRRLK